MICEVIMKILKINSCLWYHHRPQACTSRCLNFSMSRQKGRHNFDFVDQQWAAGLCFHNWMSEQIWHHRRTNIRHQGPASGYPDVKMCGCLVCPNKFGDKMSCLWTQNRPDALAFRFYDVQISAYNIGSISR